MQKNSTHYSKQLITKLIRVCGIVQGVGFRPTVWKLATKNKVKGWVINDAQGVLIKVWATQPQITSLLEQLQQQPPPLARIDSIEVTSLTFEPAPKEFSIEKSKPGQTHTQISADAATCPACIDDINQKANRRYHYPFTNCTHCGPRLSIINKVPYDRANTSMQTFKQCFACLQEYQSPADRRFHAQPNACSVCGPKVFLCDAKEKQIATEDQAIEQTAELIKQGFVVAIKGMGGIQIACDATNQQAVNKLRKRKHRYQKAFALMAKDIDMVKQYVTVETVHQNLLQSTAAPIVIFEKCNKDLAQSIAPAQNSLGFMLAYSPLHHLLFNFLTTPIVLTSGNISEDPQCIENHHAFTCLENICDYFLLHDREIVNRLDDSVIRVVANKVSMLRRARGYAPQAIKLPGGFEASLSILAMGGELKNTFCLIKDGQAIVSQYMGDLENLSCFNDYLKNLSLYKQLFDFNEQVIAIDKHPNYLSTQHGLKMSSQQHLPIKHIQHHHAHIASCMAENALVHNHKSVLGVVFDGLGMGENNELWGGEFLLAKYHNFKRLGRIKPVALLGGEKASREPWRNIYTQLKTAQVWHIISLNHPDLDIIKLIKTKNISVLDTMLSKNINSPLASSAGRLFDAAAACLGICPQNIIYEGQAAIEMESLAATATAGENFTLYPVAIQNSSDGVLEIQWQTLWLALFDDLADNVDKAMIALRFHDSVAAAIVLMVTEIYQRETLQKQTKFDTVVLSGGVFQNALLFTAVEQGIKALGLTVLSHHLLPANDGGLSLGQAVIALAKASANNHPRKCS